MDIESIYRAIDQLAQLAKGWREENSISEIERDIALERIKPLYEALKFGDIEASDNITNEVIANEPEIDLDALAFDTLNIAESPEVNEPQDESESEIEVELIFDAEESEKIEESEESEDSEIEVELLFESEESEESEDSEEIHDEESSEIEETEEAENQEDGELEIEVIQDEPQTTEPQATPKSRHDILLSLYADEPQHVEQLSIDLYTEEPEVKEEPESEDLKVVGTLEIEGILDDRIEEEQEEVREEIEIEAVLDLDDEQPIEKEIETPQTTIVEVLDFDNNEDKNIEQQSELEVIEEIDHHDHVFHEEDYAPNEIEDIIVETPRTTTIDINSLFAPEPLPTQVESMGDIMGRMIGGEIEVETISDRFASQNTSNTIFGEFASSMPTLDLTKDVNINDRYLIAQNLFDGDMDSYNTTLHHLNNMDNFDDCMIYIVENYVWDPENEATKLLISLLERKFLVD